MKKIYNFNDFKINEELDFNPIPCTYTSKYRFYSHWLKNLPISEILIGDSDNYTDKKYKAYYLIR